MSPLPLPPAARDEADEAMDLTQLEQQNRLQVALMGEI
jgi:hypothetical protein